MSPHRRFRGAARGPLALALTMIIASGAALAGCGGSPPSPRPRPPGSRASVPTPDLCGKLDRKLVKKVLDGEVTSCDSKPKPPLEYRVTFAGTTELPGGKSADARVTITLWVRYEPRTGYDAWQSMNSTDDKQRVRMLSVGKDAVYDYRVPSLAAVTKDIIVAVAPAPTPPGGWPDGEKLPERLSDIASAALAQAG